MLLYIYDYHVIRLHQICTGSIPYGSLTQVEFDYIGVLKSVSSIAAYTSWPSKRTFCLTYNWLFLHLIIQLVEVSGSFCNCLLPESIQVTSVRHLPDHPTCSGKSILTPVFASKIHILESFIFFKEFCSCLLSMKDMV
jgi:hypothetical protein